MQRKVAICALVSTVVAGCATRSATIVPSDAPDGQPVISTPSMGGKPQAPRGVTWERHDTAYLRAEAYCGNLWLDYGWQLHETPEWADGSGLSCVFDSSGHPEDCSDIGGHETTGASPLDGSLGYGLCVVHVPYGDAGVVGR